MFVKEGEKMLMFLERRPGVGILASVSGLGASVVSWFQAASIVIGFCGAIFGLLAGYYTYRVKRQEWLRLQQSKP